MGNKPTHVGEYRSGVEIPRVGPPRITYEDRVRVVAERNKWVKYSTHMDSFCSFYYDPLKRYLWVVQKIGDEQLLITKPSDEHLHMIIRKYEVEVDYVRQPGLFYGF